MAKGNKQVKQREQVTSGKQPKTVEDPQAYFKKSPIWSFRRLDDEYTKWGFAHTAQLNERVIHELRSLEGMTWYQIMSAAGGRGHGTNSHFEKVAELIPEAQARWKYLKLEEYDTVFSLRLTNTHRLYGILLNGVFQIVWYDQKHEIYPTSD